jgi:hypothetical protein
MAEVGENGVCLALGICGASKEQKTAIIDEGFDGMSNLLILDEKDITDMFSWMMGRWNIDIPTGL